MKKVEMASEFAVAEVFSLKKTNSAKHSAALQSIEQLQDHDDAYSEAQSILSEWMNRKLRLELEMDDDEEEEMSSCKMDHSESKQLVRTTQPSYNNFDELYSHLAQEEENSVVENFLQDLMETEVLDGRLVEDLDMNSDSIKKTGIDPSITMEMRHKQVKENRARRDAEREKLRREKEMLREAREEAWRLEQEKQARKRQEAREQEVMIQQEMIRLRREMEEQRSVELLARNMERDRLQKQRKGPTECPVVQKHPHFIPQKIKDRDLQFRQKKLEAKVHLLSLQCMQRHFSAWYSVVLERRVRMGKASALCDWRRQLRAWRAWRALVWARREEREAQRTEEELRQDHRRCQKAVESDRRRLLRRCINNWHVWCRVEHERKELLKIQEETRSKMAALINAAASGKLGAETPTPPPNTNPPENLIHSENISHQQDMSAALEISSPVSPATVTNKNGRSDAPPTQAWQVTRRHATLTPVELRQARDGQLQHTTTRSRCAELPGERFKHRHAALQQTLAKQKRLLKEQQEQIQHLQERQNMLELRHDAEKNSLLAAGLTGDLSTCSAPVPNADIGRGSTEKPRPKTASGENTTSRTVCKAASGRSIPPHPCIQAMEERARQRAERRREMEEQRRQRQDEKLAQMKAAEEEKLRLEEEEKQKEAERKREEKRQQRNRELEKQKRAEQEKELLQRAAQHYLNTLLLHRGLAPWKRLLEQSHNNEQRAADHYAQWLQRHCFCSWIQVVDEAHAERESKAVRLYQQILLRRAMCNWRRLKDMRFILEARAERLYKIRTERKFFMALLDHTTEQRLIAWDNQQRAEEHDARRAVKRCFAGWRRLPAVLREEKERESRREELRRKVSEILPDFRISPIDSLWSSVKPL
ncbi:coiled-coil domain-containing protein 191 [Paramisgurnus dabryanus]|uniref:coiled-coil domain-containing protein 191 n=1 Tax=Paramisgurnus dabryanus TaxID=90735 RepID=UPI0031F3915D